jgi:hypothetical protein
LVAKVSATFPHLFTMTQLQFKVKSSEKETNRIKRTEAKFLAFLHFNLIFVARIISNGLVVTIIVLFKARNVATRIQKYTLRAVLCALETVIYLNLIGLKVLHRLSVSTTDIHEAYWSGHEISISQLRDTHQELIGVTGVNGSLHQDTNEVLMMTEVTENVEEGDIEDQKEVEPSDDRLDDITRVKQPATATDKISVHEDTTYETNLISSKEAWQNYFHLKKKADDESAPYKRVHKSLFKNGFGFNKSSQDIVK